MSNLPPGCLPSDIEGDTAFCEVCQQPATDSRKGMNLCSSCLETILEEEQIEEEDARQQDDNTIH